jgi:hypothetical protein
MIICITTTSTAVASKQTWITAPLTAPPQLSSAIAVVVVGATLARALALISTTTGAVSANPRTTVIVETDSTCARSSGPRVRWMVAKVMNHLEFLLF